MLKKRKSQVLDIALPIIAEMTLYNFMAVVDLMMIGRYGGNIALSAVGLTNSIVYTLCDVFMSVGLSVAITSLVAINVGHRSFKKSEEYATTGFLLGIIIALIISLILFFFSKNILMIAGARGKILNQANQFMKMLSIAVFFKMNTEVMNSVLRGYGNTKIPFINAIIICFSKIILNILLMYGVLNIRLGICGAAIATIIAQFIGFFNAFLYVLYKSKVKITIKFDRYFAKYRAKEIIKLYVPTFMEEGVFSLSRLLTGFMILSTGSIAFSANEIASTIETLSIIPSDALGITATTMVGLKIGEGKYIEGKKASYKCGLFSIVISLILGSVFFLAPTYLVMFFIKQQEVKVIHLASKCLLIGIIEQPFIAISTVFEGALRGLKDAKTPFYITLFTCWIIRIPLVFYYIYKMRCGIHYLWWITNVQWIIDGILTFLFFNIQINKLFKIKKIKFS